MTHTLSFVLSDSHFGIATRANLEVDFSSDGEIEAIFVDGHDHTESGAMSLVDALMESHKQLVAERLANVKPDGMTLAKNEVETRMMETA
jgi:hypothetical protein